ncbi:acyltransferase [Clostridium guangxiense]|uniref:acyltransferase n=1 Tax=Clostridium guangxiense TaxID=1662055 RepID=UPI001E60F4F8|nr:LPS biosynthesis protein [Clostridium guangxiense]MCD2345381.1 LPS biosynthesis protein [Clostridium guangxiense]
MEFKKKGKNVTIYEKAIIIHPENIEIGDDVIIDDFAFICANKSVKIGSNIHITSFISITGNEEFVMEDFSGIASGTRVFTSNYYFKDDKYFEYFSAPVRLGKFSIVGSSSVIMPGAILSEGTFIGANSLIESNTITEPFSLYVGTPIRKVKNMNKDKILKLEKLYKMKYKINEVKK